MFYCEDCSKKNKWPASLAKSYGQCECCGKTAICNDVPSCQLSETPAMDKVMKQIVEDEAGSDEDLNAALDEVVVIVAKVQ